MKIYGINDNYGMKKPTLESCEVLKETDKTYRLDGRTSSMGYALVLQKDKAHLTPQDAWNSFLACQRAQRHRLHEQIEKHDSAIQEAKYQLEQLDVARA